MTRLHDIHKRLARLKRRRQWFRWTTGYSAALIALLWALAVAFPIDWYFQQSLDVAQRAVLLGLAACAVAWTFIRHTLPWLGRRETELDMALMVERHEHIDSDLVAALQFESPEAPQWGSAQLEAAVIDQVVTTGRQLNVMKSLPRSELVRRLRLLGVTAAVWAAVALVIPNHVAAFLNRILLGSMHYPTRTHIEAVRINGRNDADGPVKLLYGRDATFRVTCRDALPASGKVTLRSIGSGLSAPLDLERLGKEEGAKDSDEEQAVYQGVLPRLVEDLEYQVAVGDAWTDWKVLAATALPVVELNVEVAPPSYAVGKTPDGKEGGPVRIPAGMRQFSVVEGSQVRMSIRSDKPLKEAFLKLDDARHDLTRQPRTNGDVDAEAERWTLPAEHTPLEAVVQPIRYVLHVKDVDGQELERPIEGAIRIQADQPPRVAAAANTPFVLPAAKPTIHFRAIDDHAVGRVWLNYEIIRGDSKSTETVSAEGERPIYSLAEGEKPPVNVENVYEFDVSGLKVAKGDKIRATLHAQDYRGRRDGRTASAEPLTFQVTDEQGIWASMLEDDKQSARELKTMIQRQLGIGETQ